MRTVFAYPGELADPWILGMEAAGVEVVCPASETAAGYMAHGATLASGAPSAVIVGGGPGVAMLVPALQSAVAEEVPMLALIGQPDGSGFLDSGTSRDGTLLDAVLDGAVIRATDVAEVGEAMRSAEALLAAGRPAAVTVPLPGAVGDAASEPRGRPSATLRRRSPVWPVQSPPWDGGTVAYRDVVWAVHAAAAGGTVFVDAGQARRAARSVLPSGSFFDAPRTAPMGLGLCGAIGAALANRSTVWAVVGDGSALMFASELATAVRYRADLTIVLCANRVLGGPCTRTAGSGSELSRLADVEWPLIATGFGISGACVHSAEELAVAINSPVDGPRLIVVPTPAVDGP